MESACPDDPAFAASRVLKGRGLGNDNGEVVLAESISNQLGISSPQERVTIRLERSRNGVQQVEERVLKVAGIVRGTDRVYALSDTVRSLDLWVSHVTRYVGEEQNTGPVEHPSVLVWTKCDASKTTKLAARMGVELKYVRKDVIPKLDCDSWFRAKGKYSNIRGTRAYPVYTVRHKTGILVALTPDDPRWAAIGKPVEDGVKVLAKTSRVRRLLGSQIVDSAVSVTTLTGMVLKTQDCTARSKQATWVATTDPKALRILAALPKVLIPTKLPSATGELTFAHGTTFEEAMFVITRLPDEVSVKYRSTPDSHYVLAGPADAMRQCVSMLASRGDLRNYTFRQPANVLVVGALDRVAQNALTGLRGVVSAKVPYLTLSESGRTILAIPEGNLSKLRGKLAVSFTRPGRIDSRGDKLYLCGVVVVSDSDWRRKAAKQLAPLVLRPAEQHICVATPKIWDEIRGLNVCLDALDGSSTQAFDVYRGTRSDGKPISDDILSALRMARPTFLRARGETSVDIPFKTGVIRAEAMQPDDLERFLILRGRWIKEEKSIVLSESDLSRLGLAKTNSVGKSVTFRWSRKDAFGRDEALDVPLKLVGVSQDTVMNADLVWRIRQWTRGEVNFIDGEFQTPMEQETAYGARRVKLVASSPDDVLAIARDFEGQGYTVSHEVEKQRALTSLATALRDLTILLCGAAVLLSILLVMTSVYLFYDARKGEIASLRSLGVSRRDIVRSFIVEAVFFGLLSFIVGIALFTVASPAYGDLVSKAFGMAPGVLRIGIFAPGGPELLLVSLGLALAYSLVAQALPTCIAVRRSILGALRG